MSAILENKCELYRLTKAWMSVVETEDYNNEMYETFDGFRSGFGRLEILVFHEVSKRTSNPEAMKYDLVRNLLVNYSGTKDVDDLESAKEAFSDIPIPDCA